MILTQIPQKITIKAKDQLDKRDSGSIPYWQTYAVLFTGALMVIFNQTAIKTALPTMIESLNVSPSIGQWTISGYTLVKGIMVPITAFAMNKFRSRNLFILMMILFGTGSLIAGSGIHFGFVMTGALLQGVGAGMIIPLMQTILLTIAPVEKRGSVLGLMGIVLGIGPTIGPVLGGFVVDAFSWHFIYYFLFIGSMIVIPFTHFILADVLPLKDPTLDWKSILYSLIGFGSLLYGLSVVGTEGLDSVAAWFMSLFGCLFIILFIRRNLKLEEPMLDVSLFRNRFFAIAVIISMLGLMVNSGITNIMPMYVQGVLGRSAMISGLIVMPGGLLKSFLSPVSGRLYDRIGIAKLGVVGTFIMFLGTLSFLLVTMDTPIWTIIGMYLLVTLGFGLFNIAVTTAGMNVIPDEEMSHATPARQTARQVGSSFAITLVFAAMSVVSSFTASPQSFTAETEGVQTAISISGIRGGFFMVVVLAFASFILSLIFKENPQSKD